MIANVFSTAVCVALYLHAEQSDSAHIPLGSRCPRARCDEAHCPGKLFSSTYVTPHGTLCQGCPLCVTDTSQVGCPRARCPPIRQWSWHCTVLQYVDIGHGLCPTCIVNIC